MSQTKQYQWVPYLSLIREKMENGIEQGHTKQQILATIQKSDNKLLDMTLQNLKYVKRTYFPDLELSQKNRFTIKCGKNQNRMANTVNNGVINNYDDV